MSNQRCPSTRPTEPTTYFEELPRVIDAAYAYWHAHRARVSLPTLLQHGSAALRSALDRGEPLELDFSTPLGADPQSGESEAA
ncbi:MAG: hypothetical protein FJ095_02115 [Deltaproteobacteria bacterium]|nr:hypothetical protein [Deltaproteobacteria bacterium]